MSQQKMPRSEEKGVRPGSRLEGKVRNAGIKNVKKPGKAKKAR